MHGRAACSGTAAACSSRASARGDLGKQCPACAWRPFPRSCGTESCSAQGRPAAEMPHANLGRAAGCTQGLESAAVCRRLRAAARAGPATLAATEALLTALPQGATLLCEWAKCPSVPHLPARAWQSSRPCWSASP
ncbi:unnamed protein product [Prorocentrum cordatum]|uniref:Uncharacterized protein n=1 Tax=Prorocentrum cordatum TaxID=2364126 RepID=A0ABN9SFZ8_9DINO|nr:unnamed protein product [Polarella glacialis]